MKTWKRCGHPRTPENTQQYNNHGTMRDRCRTCQRESVYRAREKRARGAKPNPHPEYRLEAAKRGIVLRAA